MANVEDTAVTEREDVTDDGVTPAPSRIVPWVLAVGGLVGWVASFVLTLERLELLRNPNYIPTCTINTVLSCGSVMQSPQAAAFGFPNPLIGIAAFAVVTTIGVAALGGVRFPRWFWAGLLAGSAAGTVFVHWLMVQSVYDIGALCPYCMVVWVVTIPIFWYTLLHVVGTSRSRTVREVGTVPVRLHWAVLGLWYLLIAFVVLERFWLNAPS
ncbi:Uncharacterized membrane protein [Streptoalloteichus hindustanus]|uniref:Uncharacterized membrane protein n=1 Tax=Streptoalloteichus hindustanus TaxID=2017 RepID=A0A1M5BGQ6_STRHI|nr:Uncharacterized membrane protein [Streptoalloteichus hindustanus]